MFRVPDRGGGLALFVDVPAGSAETFGPRSYRALRCSVRALPQLPAGRAEREIRVVAGFLCFGDPVDLAERNPSRFAVVLLSVVRPRQ